MSHHWLFQKKKNGHTVQMNLSIGEQNSQNISSWNNLKKNADFCDVLSDLGIFHSVFENYLCTTVKAVYYLLHHVALAIAPLLS